MYSILSKNSLCTACEKNKSLADEKKRTRFHLKTPLIPVEQIEKPILIIYVTIISWWPIPSKLYDIDSRVNGPIYIYPALNIGFPPIGFDFSDRENVFDLMCVQLMGRIAPAQYLLTTPSRKTSVYVAGWEKRGLPEIGFRRCASFDISSFDQIRRSFFLTFVLIFSSVIPRRADNFLKNFTNSSEARNFSVWPYPDTYYCVNFFSRFKKQALEYRSNHKHTALRKT